MRRKLEKAGLAEEFVYHGVLDREGKIAFLQSLDVLSVPATYDEPKGMFLLEAMANGVPVVQPRRGAFVDVEYRRRITGGVGRSEQPCGWNAHVVQQPSGRCGAWRAGISRCPGPLFCGSIGGTLLGVYDRLSRCSNSLTSASIT